MFANNPEEMKMKFKGKDASLREHVERLGAAHEGGILDRIAADVRQAAAEVKPPTRCGDAPPWVVVKPAVCDPVGRQCSRS